MGIITSIVKAGSSVLGRKQPASGSPGGRASVSSRRGEGTPDHDEYKWSKIGSQKGVSRSRDIDAYVQDQALEIAHKMNSGNPIAHRLIDIPAEYSIGPGIQFIAEDPRVQEVLSGHWTDIENNWDIGQFERAREFGLTGELCFSVSVNPVDGHVKLGFIDPELIDSIVRDPLATTQPHAVILKKMEQETERRVYRVINKAQVPTDSPAYGRLVGLPVDDKEMEEFGFKYKKGDKVESKSINAIAKDAVWEGSCFFFKMNSPITATRGWSDLLPGLDWLDAHDQLLFSQVEKAIESAKYIWDILVKGATKETLEEFMDQLPEFSPGQRVGRNESVEYGVHSPDLHLEDVATLAGVLKNHILAGAGYPPVWFAESLTSRASAPEMTEPSFKHLMIRQRYIAYYMKYVFRYVLDTAFLKGSLRPDNRGMNSTKRKLSAAFYIRMPDVSAKDQRMLSIAVRNFASALTELREAGLVEEEDAKRMVKYFLDLTGVNTGRDEPRTVEFGSDADPSASIDTMFHRVQSEGGAWSDGDNMYYLSPDPQLEHGTNSMSNVMESKIEFAYSLSNQNGGNFG
jgi:hypothetical protein